MNDGTAEQEHKQKSDKGNDEDIIGKTVVVAKDIVLRIDNASAPFELLYVTA